MRTAPAAASTGFIPSGPATLLCARSAASRSSGSCRRGSCPGCSGRAGGRIGHRRPVAATPVGRRARVGPGALGPDPQRPRRSSTETIEPPPEPIDSISSRGMNWYRLMTVSVDPTADRRRARRRSSCHPCRRRSLPCARAHLPRNFAPVTPPTGPEPIVKRGAAATWSAGTTPPDACMIRSGCW